MTRILALAGSTRRESLNKKLARATAELARAAGAEVTLVDLADLPLPLYDGDLEQQQGLPDHALELKRLLKEHDGLLLACPEYNSSIPAVLKNAIDWASRRAPGEAPLESFQGKVAALTSASPGQLGGLRGLVTVRSILGNLGVLVLPRQQTVPRAHEAFAEDGSLKDEALAGKLRALAEELVGTTQRLCG
jgi:NAD(P)H-dependent FMN reductase